ncbi:hypothetical protein DFH06DRAFT_1316423 [Mycena polygramma]|nr:hypothetical protein DFH06DRAFT_1316423 [Mycena polygramma]
MSRPPPPAYTEDDAELHLRLAGLTLTTGTPPPSVPPPPPSAPSYRTTSVNLRAPAPAPPVLYAQITPATTVIAESWADAADETQGLPGASPHRLTPKRKPRKKSGAYAVFCGIATGYFPDWSTVHPLVIGVPNSVYQGYRTEDIAQAAYEYAYERGWTRVITKTRVDLPTTLGPYLTHLPTPSAVADVNPLHGDSDGRWYVVYKGISPGVYGSSLECNLNTRGLRCATYDAWDSVEVAIARFEHALGNGRSNKSLSKREPTPREHVTRRRRSPLSITAQVAYSLSLTQPPRAADDASGRNHYVRMIIAIPEHYGVAGASLELVSDQRQSVSST